MSYFEINLKETDRYTAYIWTGFVKWLYNGANPVFWFPVDGTNVDSIKFLGDRNQLFVRKQTFEAAVSILDKWARGTNDSGPVVNLTFDF